MWTYIHFIIMASLAEKHPVLALVYLIVYTSYQSAKIFVYSAIQTRVSDLEGIRRKMRKES
jgi:hypothetical protein